MSAHGFSSTDSTQLKSATSSAPMSTWDQMAVQRAPESSSLITPRTLATASPSSTDMNGKVATSRSAKTATLVLRPAALEAAGVSAVAAVGSGADLAVVAVDLAAAVGLEVVVVASAAAVVDSAEEDSAEVQVPVALMQVLLLLTRPPIHSQTTRPPEVNVVLLSSFATQVQTTLQSLDIPTNVLAASLVDQQRGSSRPLHHYRPC